MDIATLENPNQNFFDWGPLAAGTTSREQNRGLARVHLPHVACPGTHCFVGEGQTTNVDSPVNTPLSKYRTLEQLNMQQPCL